MPVRVFSKAGSRRDARSRESCSSSSRYPGGPQVAERLLPVRDEQVRRQQCAQQPYVGLEHLHHVVLVEGDVLEDEAYGVAELARVSHHGQRVQRVDQGERVVAQDVVDVDVRRVVVVGASAGAVDGVEFVFRKRVLHVTVVSELEHTLRLLDHAET
ncbi:hypothetical protein MTO96_001728 [Rhipicephalus appendiculatus]